MKQRGWIITSGLVWFFIGMFLLYKGLRLIPGAPFPIAVALLIGFLKGRFVLAKTVRRVVSRIVALPLPIRFKEVYSPAYWVLIGSMVAIGMSFRFLPISATARGMVDVAIGSALINGAMLYFRAAQTTCDTDFPAQSP